MYYYREIMETHQELKNCYEEFLKNYEKLDEKSNWDNGGMTYVNRHRKMYGSLTFWMGFDDQLEYKTYLPVYYRNY